MTNYDTIIKQIISLAEESSEFIPLAANVSSLLFHAMEDVNWAGFYIVEGDALLLGPFQGKAACVRIAEGRGVCGTAWAKDKTMVVPDVHAFPGHIACDSESRSEIVIPVHRDGKVTAVLDVDSRVPARFTEDDVKGLEKLVEALERVMG